MEAYSRLARLPSPKLQPVEAGTLVRRIVGSRPGPPSPSSPDLS